MANKYLGPIYKMLFDREFSYGNFEHRLEMQKVIYLLQDMGVPVGNYGFRWHYYGPYSQNLQDDMYYESGHNSGDIVLSKEYMEIILRLKSVIDSNERQAYDIPRWIECIASMHYLRENVMDFHATSEDIINELKKRKNYLDDEDANKVAYRLMGSLFA